MSQPKSLAESLFDDLFNEGKSEQKNESKVTSKSMKYKEDEPIELKHESKITKKSKKNNEDKPIKQTNVSKITQKSKKNNEGDPIEVKNGSKVTKKSKKKNEDEPIELENKITNTDSFNNSITSEITVDPLSNFVSLNDKLMKKLRKCRVKLPKIGHKKLLQMAKRTIKKTKKNPQFKTKQKILQNSYIDNENNKSNLMPSKSTVVQLSRVNTDINNEPIETTRKRKRTDSILETKQSKKKNSPKLFFKLDAVANPNRKKARVSTSATISVTLTQQLKVKSKGEQKKYIDDKSFTKSYLQDTFGRQFFKCHVRVNKIHSLNNLNVKDLETDLERKEKRKLKKKTKGLNKSVSFVETVEVFGESDSDDNNPHDLNQDIIELDALLDDQKIDGTAGGDDGNIKNIDCDTTTTTTKKQSDNNEKTSKNGDVTECISTDDGDDSLLLSISKEKSNISPGKIGRIRKSFSPLKSEENQQSPRNKLLRKCDEKSVKGLDLTVDDDDDDDEDDVKNDNIKLTETIVDVKSDDEDVQITTNKNEQSSEAIENENCKKDVNEQYEPLSSDDSNDFIDTTKDDEIEFISKTNINKEDKENLTTEIQVYDAATADDEDDDYYLPKPKTSQQNDENKNENNQSDNDDDNEVDDEVETIEKIMSSVNESKNQLSNNKDSLNIKDNCNGDEDGSDIFQKVVESIDMLNSNIPNESSNEFGEELRISQDTYVIDKELTIQPTITETIPTISESPVPKLSFTSFLKSSIQSIKTKIMPDSPKRSSIDDIITASTATKPVGYRTENCIDDDALIPPRDILLDETDDESSALLGDPVLGGREMSY